MKVPDKLGNFLTVEPNGTGDLIVGVETIHGAIPNIGILDKKEKLFILLRNSIPGKFLTEATTFTKVQILNEVIGLGSLRFLLHIPHGAQIESFAEMITINPDLKLIQFKDEVEAMTYMTEFYRDYFNRTLNLPTAVIGEMTIDDPKKFLRSSFETIKSWMDKKQDPTPYFLNLVRYYNFCSK